MSNSIEEAQARLQKRKRLLTPGFSLARHFGAFAAFAVAGFAVAGWLLQWARPRDLWIVPVYFVIANLIENLVHRFPMHRPVIPRVPYRNHTLGHHRAFHHDSMEITHWDELNLVMMPWFTIGVFFAAVAPVVALVAWWLGRGVAGLFLLTAIFTFLLYEGMHALYHFPLSVLQRIGLLRLRAFRFIYHHHRHHHRLVRMRWVNFNISFPLTDWLLGTLETEAAWQAGHERRMVAGKTAVNGGRGRTGGGADGEAA